MFDVYTTSVEINPRTSPEIVVGNTYFLSHFRDVSGAYVKVLEEPTETHRTGWKDFDVKVEMMVKVGDPPSKFYQPGDIATVHGTNLYERREDANPKNKKARK